MSPCELQVKTLQGGVFTLDVKDIETVQQLKQMLLEKFPGDPVEKKILKVEVLHGSCLLKNDAQTLSEAALHAESDVTAIYRRNEIEAARKNKRVRKQAFCQVNIPETVTKVSSLAFSNCRNLEKVTIPDSVTEIESHAFEGCSSLASIKIPDSVTQIGSCAFYGCSSLEAYRFPVGRVGGSRWKSLPLAAAALWQALTRYISLIKASVLSRFLTLIWRLTTGTCNNF